MSVRNPRTLVLDPPVEVEALWKLLAPALPSFARLFVPEVDRDDVRFALGELRGPAVKPDRRSYTCLERGSYADLHLISGTALRWVALTVTQRTVSNGLSVLDAYSDMSEHIDRLSVGCHTDDFDKVLAVFRSVIGCSAPPDR